MIKDYLNLIDSLKSSKSWLTSFVPKVILAIVAFTLLVVVLQVFTGENTFSVASSGCDNVVATSSSGGPNGPGTVAHLDSVTLKNNGNSDCTGTLFGGRAWCLGVTGMGVCGANLTWQTVMTGTLKAHASTTIPLSLSQQIGNNGRCGSAQVDVSIDQKTALAGATAFGTPCLSPTPTPTPPPRTHLECRNLACVRVSGPGRDLCRMDSDCKPITHTACEGLACVVKQGPGRNECRLGTNDCVPVNHTVCDNRTLACKLVPGPGQNECRLGTNDCVPVTMTPTPTPTPTPTSTPSTSITCNSLSVSPNSGNVSLNVTAALSGSATGISINSFRFNFGDGTGDFNTNNSSIGHTFNSTGTFTVNGFVIGSDGSVNGGSGSCQQTVVVGSSQSQFPVCDNMSVSPQSGNSPLTVTANLSGHTVNGGSISDYKFNFGDGTGDFIQTGTSLSHTFNNTGTFVVNGTVIDNNNNQAGGSGSCQETVSVVAPGVVPPPIGGQVLGARAIPSTGPEDLVWPLLAGSGLLGFVIRRFKKI